MFPETDGERDRQRLECGGTRRPVKGPLMIIAVDGPAASGKSTIARKLAEALSFKYINSGALYRGLGLHLKQQGVSVEDEGSLHRVLDHVTIDFDGDRYIINGDDVTDRLHTPEGSQQASVVAKVPAIREKVNRELRRLVHNEHCVVEGRDIGTVVFPDSDLKVYLEASLQERARRRLQDYAKLDAGQTLEEISREIAARDDVDSKREIAPLQRPEGAIIVNSTDMTPEQVINHILAAAEARVPGFRDESRRG